MDSPFITILVCALTLVYDVVYCWGCWKCLPVRRFWLLAALHMAFATVFITIKTIGIQDAWFIGPATVIYIALPLFFLKKISIKNITLVVLVNCSTLTYCIGCGLTMGLLAGFTSMPETYTPELLAQSALSMFIGNMLVVGHFSLMGLIANRNEQSTFGVQLSVLAFITIQAIVWTAGVALYLGAGRSDDYLSYLVFALAFFLEIAGIVYLAKNYAQGERRQIQQEKLEETLRLLQEQDKEGIEAILSARKIRHDINNQLSLASALANDGRIDEAINALRSIQATVPANDSSPSAQ